jgi:alcohol dehydrogenase class IV
MTNTNDIMDYLEVIGNGVPVSKKSLPFIAVPTTSGTGAEATKNATILSAHIK